MREDIRLDYLTALGVPNWVPRVALANAAERAPVELPVGREPALAQPSVPEVVAPAAARSMPESLKRAAPPVAEISPAAVEPAEQSPPALPVAPFYMQLWLAGPCALLIETAEPGLESGSSAYRLLADILRAVELPGTPSLFADFRWPLVRSRQLDSSAQAASEGLQAFLQARLEGKGIVSIGCFGELTTLLVDADLSASSRLVGCEEALEQLPAAWFAPVLDTLMAEPVHKARLWQLLKRVRTRWIERE